MYNDGKTHESTATHYTLEDGLEAVERLTAYADGVMSFVLVKNKRNDAYHIQVHHIENGVHVYNL